MTQYARPTSDIDAATWTDEGTVDNDGNLYTSLDEVTLDNDDSYISGSDGDGTAILGLNSVTDPVSSIGHILHIWYRSIGSGAGEKMDFYLYQGTTQICGVTNQSNRSGSYLDIALTLTAIEADSITDYSALRIHIAENTIGATEEVRVSMAYLEVPDGLADIIIDNPITISNTNADHEFSKIVINEIAISNTNSDGHVSFEASNPQSASVTNADSVFVRSSTPVETVSVTESDLNSVFVRTSITLSDTGGLHKYLKILKDLTISVTESAFELAWIYFAGDAISNTGGDHDFIWTINNATTISETGGDHKQAISIDNITTASITGSDFYRTTTVDNPSTGSITGGDNNLVPPLTEPTVSETAGEVGEVDFEGAVTPNLIAIILPKHKSSKPPSGSFRLNKDSSQAKGLVGWWPTASGGGNVLHDLSRLGNHGTLTGGIDRVRDGKFGQVLALDGINGWVSVPDSPILEPKTGITMSIWAKRNNAVVRDMLMGKADAILYSNSPYWMEFWDGPTGEPDDIHLSFVLSESQTVKIHKYDGSGPAVTDNDWHHIAITWDNDTVRAYVDGKQHSTTWPWANHTLASDNNPFGIGRINWATSVFDGLLTDARLYNWGLPSSLIREIASPQTMWELYEPISPKIYPSAWVEQEQSIDAAIVMPKREPAVLARAFDDGSSQYLYSDTPAVNSPPVTMACWFYSDDLTTFQTLMAMRTETPSWKGWSLSAAGNIAGDPIRFHHIGASTQYAETPTGYSANTWHHVCGIAVDNINRRVFIDHNKGTDATEAGNVVVDNTTIGASYLSKGAGPVASNFWSGLIAKVGIWDVALDDIEVAKLATGVSPLEIRHGHLIRYVPWYSGRDEDIINGYHFTAINSPTFGAPPQLPSSLLATSAKLYIPKEEQEIIEYGKSIILPPHRSNRPPGDYR